MSASLAVTVCMMTAALPTATDMRITEESITTLVRDMRSVYISANPQKVRSFLEHHLTEDGAFDLTVTTTMPSQHVQQKHSQTFSMTKAEYTQQNEAGIAQIQDFRYDVTVTKMTIAEDGQTATVIMRTSEQGKLPNPLSRDGALLRLNSEGLCTVELLANLGLPAVAAVDCDVRSTLR